MPLSRVSQPFLLIKKIPLYLRIINNSVFKEIPDTEPILIDGPRFRKFILGLGLVLIETETGRTLYQWSMDLVAGLIHRKPGTLE